MLSWGFSVQIASVKCRRFFRTLRIAICLGFSASAFATAQDIKLNVTFVCNGERLFVESCNIRDLSDSSSCMVGHPDRPLHNGFMAYTYETRGSLKKLLPTCKQPTAQEIARADAIQKKQQDAHYNAAVAKANHAATPTNPAAANQAQL